MAKKQVVEVQCERCPRKEYIDPTVPAAPPIVISIGATTHKFEDLCSSCRKSVEASIAGIVKKLDGRSPVRMAKKEPSAKAETLPPANGAVVTPKVSPSHARGGSAPVRTT